MAQQVFKRYEKKYILTAEQRSAFIAAADGMLDYDGYGSYTICNIYFDTPNYSLIRNSIEKPEYKEKMRLRCYNTKPDGDSKVFLELKKKFDGVVYKRRVSLTLDEAYRYINGEDIGKDSQVLHEIDYFMDFYNPSPKVYLAYDREAFVGRDNPDFRLTLDTNIRWRDSNLGLENGDCGDILLGDDKYVMEVKISDAEPLWLARLLSELEIYPASYSKYGTCYKECLSKGIHSSDTAIAEADKKTALILGGVYCA